MKIVNTFFCILVASIAFGQVGVETDNPQEALHVKGSMRFEPTDSDSSVGVGYTLVSDEQGNARWQNLNLEKTSIAANYNSNSYETIIDYSARPWTVSGHNFRYTGSTITLPKGKWMVMMSLGIYVENKLATEVAFHPLPDGRHIWVKVGMFDTNADDIEGNNSSTADIHGSAQYVSSAIIGPNTNGLVTGELFIDQQSDTPKTYYFKYRIEHFSPTDSQLKVKNLATSPEIVPENFIMAYPINF